MKLYVFALAMSIFSVSCEDAIFIDPADEIVESNAIENIDDLESAVIGVYATMGLTNGVYWNSLFTDELKLPPSNNGQGIQVHTWSINSNDGTAGAIYGGFSTTINRANRVLAALPNVPTNNDEELALKNRFQGELLAIRGWAHFNLLTYFSPSYTNDSALGVPYLDFPVVLEKPARNTVGEVFAGINNDLTLASQLIPNDFNDNIFFTKNAILALEARIALYREDYPTAISKSSQLISQYQLATIDAYPGIWFDIDDTENIFKLARVEGDGAIGQIYNASQALVYWLASDKLVSTYETDDIRLNSFVTTSNQRINKYPGNVSAIGLNDIKVFRISEQYLIRAEAYANSSQLGLAADDFNSLRENRIVGATPVVFSGLQDAVDKIMEERYRELAFEGHRFLDLKRNGFGVDRLSSDCDFLAADNGCTLSSTDYKFTLPIPQAEVFANPNMVQNDGYNN